MSERKKLKIISSTEIMNTPMKKQRFIVDGMIYPGVHILSGDPKIGKSWMVLDMCLAVAKGKNFSAGKPNRVRSYTWRWRIRLSACSQGCMSLPMNQAKILTSL